MAQFLNTSISGSLTVSASVGSTTSIFMGSDGTGYGESHIRMKDFTWAIKDEDRNDYNIRRTWSSALGDYLRLSNVTTGTDDIFILSQNSGSLFYTDDALRMIIQPGGNVGIGISNPSQKLDVAGNINSTGRIKAATYFEANNNQSRDKIRVWPDTSYAIGMKSGYTYGHISNDYAMSFQMNDSNTRGFWWGDTGHTDAQGAMSLTTNGRLVVAASISVGEGQSVTGPSTKTLYVNGDGTIAGDLVVTGTVTAEEFHTEFVSASIIFKSGSTQFGNDSNDTHIFSGSLTQYTSATRYIKLRGGSGDLQVVSDNNTAPVAYIKGTGTADLLNVFDNTTEVFTILDGGNVGIGTDSPTVKLQVEGDVSASGYLKGDTLYALNDVVVADQILHYGDTDTNISFTDDQIVLNAGNVEFIRLSEGLTDQLIINEAGASVDVRIEGDTDTNLIRTDATNNRVGIGTGSPAQKLDVAGTLHATNMYVDEYIYHNADTNTYMRFITDQFQFYAGGYQMFTINENGTQDVVIVNEDANDIDFRVEGSGDTHLLFTDAANDRVGIGIATPSHKLHVSGTYDVVKIEGSGSANSSSLFEVHGNNGLLFAIDDDLSDSLFSVNTIAGLPVIEAFSDNRVVMGAFNQNDFVISGSKIGIGTDAPTQNLHVHQSDSSFSYAQFSNSTTGTTDGDGVIIGVNSSEHAIFYNYENTPMRFGTNGTERVRIDNNGNVSIGTTSTYTVGGTAKLTVAGGGPFSLGASNSDLMYIRRNAAGTYQWQTYNGGNTGNIHLQPYGGNVGIGTTAPSQKLTVTGNISGSGWVGGNVSQTRDKFRVWNDSNYTIGFKSGYTYGHLNSDYAMSFQMNQDDDRGFWWGHSNQNDAQGAMALTTNGRLVVATSISVGEGQSSTSPSSETLYVDGDAVVTGTVTAQEFHTEFVSASIMYDSGSTKFGNSTDDNHDFTGSINLLAQSGASGLDIKRGTNTYMNLNNSSTRNEFNFKSTTGLRFFHGTDSTSPLFISSSGRVGIGSTTPHRLLDVRNGSGKGEVVVAGTTGADLYFRPNTSYSAGGNFGIFTTGLTSGTYQSTMTIKGYSDGVNTIMTLKGDGKIGVNTTTPDALFNIESSDTIGWSSTLVSASILIGSATSGVGIDSNELVKVGDHFYIGTSTTNHDVVFRAGGSTDRMTLDGATGHLNVVAAVTASAFKGDGSALTGISADPAALSEVLGTGNDAQGQDIDNLGAMTATGLISASAFDASSDSTFNQNATVKGNLNVGQYIYHHNDVNTYIQLLGDHVQVNAGGIQMLTINENGTQDKVVINEDSNDVDFRVEGNGVTHLLFTDAGLDRVGINNSAPSQSLDVEGNIQGNTYISTASSILRRFVASWASANTHDVIYNGWNASEGDYVYLKTPGNGTSGHGAVLVGDNVFQVGRSNVETGAMSSGLDTKWMVVSSSGDVGIGTDSPFGRLHVYDAATGDAGMTIQNSTEASGNSAALWFKQAGSASDYRKGAIFFVNDGAGHGRGDLYFATSTSANSAAATTSDVKMVVKNDGKVGIGTTSPSYKLDVEGSIGTNDYIYHNGDSNTYFGFDTADSYRIVAGGTERLRVNTTGVVVNEGGSSATDFRVESDTQTHALFVEGSSGNVGIGTSTPGAALTVNGTIEATEKSFNIEHPTKPGKRLVYGVLEGPEHGVYVRGKSTEKVIKLPEVWTGLVHEDSLTVQLTCKGKPFQIWVEDIRDNKVYINTDVEEFEFYYYVQGERKDVDKLIIERDAD